MSQAASTSGRELSGHLFLNSGKTFGLNGLHSHWIVSSDIFGTGRKSFHTVEIY